MLSGHLLRHQSNGLVCWAKVWKTGPKCDRLKFINAIRWAVQPPFVQ